MKKIILAIAIVGFTTIDAQAQNAKSTILSIAANVGVPTSTGLSFAYGADLQADFGVAATTKITGSIGYENYKVKGVNVNTYFVPLLAGAKFNLGSDKLYGHAQVGYGFAKGGSGAFGYAPSVGYYVSPNFDIALKYLAFSRDKHTDGSVNLRLAYSF